MHYLMTYTVRAEHIDAASARFLETEGAAPPNGVKLQGRWHAVAGRRGWMVIESVSVEAMHRYSRMWHDVLDLEITPVLDDATIAKVMVDMGAD